VLRTRIIPCLLLKGSGFVKTVKFKKPVYLGDPVNIVRIFNDKEVDELAILDISASVKNKAPAFDLLADIAGECFMPLSYGGGLRRLEDLVALNKAGYEKLIINTHAVENPEFVRKAADQLGSQSVVVSLDVKRSLLGKYEVLVMGGRRNTKKDPVALAEEMERWGAGEILLNSIDRDGTQKGFDLQLIDKVSSAVDIPVIACGGAGSVQDIAQAAREGGASGVGVGSYFVFHGRHRAVLINVPPPEEVLRAIEGP